MQLFVNLPHVALIASSMVIAVCVAGNAPYIRFAPDGANTQVFYNQINEDFSCSGAGSVPNRTLWTYDTGYIANNEKQWYTANPNNNFLSSDINGDDVCGSTATDDGYLQIVARMDTDYRGSNFNYSSSRLTSRGLFCVELDSLVEVRARVPGGRGTWPALWLLGPDSYTIGWPKTGEIDFMEAVGYIPDRTFTTIHGLDLTPSGEAQIGSNVSAPTLYDEFHVYQVLWNTSGIFFFTDNTSTFTIPRTEIVTWEPFSEDRCFELIMNLAIGGDWGGIDGIDNSIFPVNFTIDYVRVYSSNENASYINSTGYNTPGQTFGLGECGSTTSLGQQNWKLANLDRLLFPQFSPYVTTESIPKLDTCTGTNIFVGGVGDGYLYGTPGGSSDYDVVRNPTTGILETSDGHPLYTSAELLLYSQGTKASSSSCCVYFKIAAAEPTTTTAAPSIPTPVEGTPDDEGMSTATKVIIGVVVAAVVLAAVVLVNKFVCTKRRGVNEYGHIDTIEAANAEHSV